MYIHSVASLLGTPHQLSCVRANVSVIWPQIQSASSLVLCQRGVRVSPCVNRAGRCPGRSQRTSGCVDVFMLLLTCTDPKGCGFRRDMSARNAGALYSFLLAGILLSPLLILRKYPHTCGADNGAETAIIIMDKSVASSAIVYAVNKHSSPMPLLT